MKVCVIGAGTMGAGIAQVFAQNGHDTLLCDIKQELVAAGYSSIQKSLERLAGKGRISVEEKDAVLARIHPVTDKSAASACSLFVEAVIENMEIKKQLFRELDDIVPGTRCLQPIHLRCPLRRSQHLRKTPAE